MMAKSISITEAFRLEFGRIDLERVVASTMFPGEEEEFAEAVSEFAISVGVASSRLILFNAWLTLNSAPDRSRSQQIIARLEQVSGDAEHQAGAEYLLGRYAEWCGRSLGTRRGHLESAVRLAPHWVWNHVALAQVLREGGEETWADAMMRVAHANVFEGDRREAMSANDVGWHEAITGCLAELP